jgi:hypothetical protein
MAVEPTELNPTFSTRRNKFGQLSALFAETDAREETTHGEHMILRTIREFIATETDPVANKDWDSWAWLRIEVGARLEGKHTGDFDRKRNPIGNLAVEAVCLWIKSERKRDFKQRRKLFRKSKEEATEGATDAK